MGLIIQLNMSEAVVDYSTDSPTDTDCPTDMPLANRVQLGGCSPKSSKLWTDKGSIRSEDLQYFMISSKCKSTNNIYFDSGKEFSTDVKGLYNRTWKNIQNLEVPKESLLKKIYSKNHSIPIDKEISPNKRELRVALSHFESKTINTRRKFKSSIDRSFSPTCRDNEISNLRVVTLLDAAIDCVESTPPTNRPCDAYDISMGDVQEK